MHYLFRFEKPRIYQDAMLDDIYNAVSEKRSILVNAPTGIGKTDAAMAAALTCALSHDLNVMFLTPKISQHKIAVESIRGIREKFGLNFTFVDLVGKQNLCTNSEVNAISNDAFYGACASRVKQGKCHFFKNARKVCDNAEPYESKWSDDIKDANSRGHNALFDASFEHGMCAYEVATKLASTARVIVADYAHMLNPYTKPAFLKKIAQNISDTIIIWDEAHNIISSANAYFSSTLSNASISRAETELKSISSKIDISYLTFAITKLAEQKLARSEEAFVESDDLPGEISSNIGEITGMLEKAGLEYAEKSKTKRSAILHIAKFLNAWQQSGQEIKRIIAKKGKTTKLIIDCLYPKKALPIFQEAHSNVFMSATLLPLNMYADLLGMDSAQMESYPSPFPAANRRAFIDESVTTKYTSRSIEQYKRIAERISKVKGAVKGNIAVFFPSFEFMNNVFRYMKDSSIYLQHRDMNSPSVEGLLSAFKSSQDSMLFGVMGGSLSEGVDYANNIIKGVIIVGIPLTKPDLELSARIDYFDSLFSGRGNEYAYTIPAIIRSVQAAGRAIRSEKDRAVIVFMDKRYRYPIYSMLIKDALVTVGRNDYVNEISNFWKSSA